MSKRYKTKFPLPTKHEREVLTILIEECAEVQQRATKMLRFGRDEVQPGQSDTNRRRLSLEVGDLWAMLAIANDLYLINRIEVTEGQARKKRQLATFMQTRKPKKKRA